jgi:threonine dehydrogenase-like Zn-dependent dehydrogenase
VISDPAAPARAGIGNALNKGVMMLMNQASVKRHLPRLFEHVRVGNLEPGKIITLITHRVPLEEVSDAYHMFSSELDDCIKCGGGWWRA